MEKKDIMTNVQPKLNGYATNKIGSFWKWDTVEKK